MDVFSLHLSKQGCMEDLEGIKQTSYHEGMTIL